MNDDSVRLADSTLVFSRNIIAFCKAERQTAISQPQFSQMIRSATSRGANYTEANNTASKADFKNKVFIAKKEAAETKYRLTLLADVVSDTERCRELFAECHHLLMTLQKVINTLNNRSPKTAHTQ